MADALLPPHSWEAVEAAKTPHEAPTGALADTGETHLVFFFFTQAFAQPKHAQMAKVQ